MSVTGATDCATTAAVFASVAMSCITGAAVSITVTAMPVTIAIASVAVAAIWITDGMVFATVAKVLFTDAVLSVTGAAAGSSVLTKHGGATLTGPSAARRRRVWLLLQGDRAVLLLQLASVQGLHSTVIAGAGKLQ